VVTLSGKDHYLGRWRSAESRAEYDRLISEWLASGRRFPEASVGLSVSELILHFWRHAEKHYRRPDGTPTSELADYRRTLRPLRERYGQTPANEFGPLALKAVRQGMIDAGLCRGVINQRIGRIVRMFKWGASEEIVAESVYSALTTVTGLAIGRTEARETAPVGPVADAVVEATLAHVTAPVAAIIRLQRLTGMRPGEACMMRACDIDMTGPVWVYRPMAHKLSYRGKARAIAIGPRGQEIIRPLLTLATHAYLFKPARGGERYGTVALDRAIARACVKANAPHWHPHQLRHAHATEVRRQFGLEAAQVCLGHAQANVTEIYAVRDEALAVRVAAEIG
jgi:integrase